MCNIGSERRELEVQQLQLVGVERKIIGIYYLGNDTPQREHLTFVSKLRSRRWLRQEGQ